MAFGSRESIELLRDARSLLAERLSTHVELDDPTELESDSTVLRARMSVGSVGDRWVVVKRVTDTGFDLPGHVGAPQRMLNEWAGLDFLTEIGGGGVVAPGLIAGDRGKQMLVIEDMGELESLESGLLGDEPDRAVRGLDDFAAVLGLMHGMAWGKEQTFADSQRRVGTGSPMSDTTVDQRARRDLFSACFEATGLELPDRLWRTVQEVEQVVHEQSPFRSLVHADAGPHNVLMSDEGARLIDFEFCVFHNGLADAAGPRLGFPQTAQARRVPESLVRSFETRYRQELAGHVMVAEDDRLFRRSMAAASAHWALNRMAAAWLVHIAPRIENGEAMGSAELERVASVLLLVDGFTSYARHEQILEELAEALEAVGRSWQARWPDITPVDVYPSLRNVV